MMFPSRKPWWIASLGSHAEKTVFVAAKQLLQGVALNANLVQATPGATYAFLHQLEAPDLSNHRGYIIDPSTYGFGVPRELYLESVKQDPNTGKPVVNPRRTFLKLSEHYGAPFDSSFSDQTDIRSLQPGDLMSSQNLESVASRVIGFQLNHLENHRDSDLIEDEASATTPICVTAPYFYTPDLGSEGWSPVNIALAKATLASGPPDGVQVVISIDRAILQSTPQVEQLIRIYSDLPVKNYLIWVSNFEEHSASPSELAGYKLLVQELRRTGKPVVGYFAGSMALLSGVDGIIHGLGYGEYKNLTRRPGGGPVRARFYMPPLKRFVSYDNAYEIVRDLSPERYAQDICNCVVCSSMVTENVSNDFEIFGKLEVSPYSSRNTLIQTTESIQASRLHFAAARHRELELVRSGGTQAFVQDVKRGLRVLPNGTSNIVSRHLETWINEFDVD